MKLENDNEFDALDVLLREYLLSRDPETSEGMSLMETALSQSGNGPLSEMEAPDPEIESEMLAALQEKFGVDENAPLLTASSEKELDTHLKGFLLSQGRTGLRGEAFMRKAASKVDGKDPVFGPSKSEGARMVAQLQAAFAKEEDDDPVVVPFWTRPKLIGAGIAAAAAVIIALLLFNPFAGSEDGEGTNAGVVIADGESAGTNEGDSGTESPEILPDLESEFPSPLEIGEMPDFEEEAPQPKPKTKRDGTKTETVVEQPSQPKPKVRPNSKPRKIYPEEKRLAGLFARTSQESQWFDLKPNESTWINAENGTRLHIPANAFVDDNNRPVTGPVALEIREVYEAEEYLLSNLPLQSNDRALVSGGGLFVEARSGAEVLQMAPGKELYIEFNAPANVNTANMQLSAAGMNNSGELDWQAVASGAREPLIPMTIADLKLDALYLAPEVIEDLSGGDKNKRRTYNRWNRSMQDAHSGAYMESWVHTREFLVRSIIAHDFGYDHEIVDIYLEEADSSLARADKMVAQMLRERGTPESNQLSEVFESLSDENLGYAASFRTYGVDFNSPDVREKLAAKKISEQEIDRLMRIHDLQDVYREEVAYAMNDWQNQPNGVREMVARNNPKWKSLAPQPGYALNQTGWASLNRPLSGNGTVEIDVNNGGDLPENWLNTYLVFDNGPSVLKAEQTSRDAAKFARVPKNQSGWVISLGYQDDQAYLGYKKVQASRKGSAKVTVRRMSVDQLKRKLRQIL